MTVVKDASERKNLKGRPRISGATKELVVRLYNEDKPCREIAEACNISIRSVFRIIDERRKLQDGC